MAISKSSFGSLNQKPVALFTLTNNNGTEIQATNYGCIIISIKVIDRDSNLKDIALGFDNLNSYVKDTPYFGAVIGRFSNRIAGGEFRLNGVKYTLAINNGVNHLHGGLKGFDKVIWNYETSGNSIKFSYLSPDGEEGYPGNLKTTVTYSLTEKNELDITYGAVSDKDTIINLTNHSYFNLDGEGSGSILDHRLTLNADYFHPTNQSSIPLGELRPVKGTDFDFTMSTAIGQRIDNSDEQLVFAGGYDHNYVIRKSETRLKPAATIRSPASGIKMEVYTTEPGVQFYTGNYLNGTLKGKSGNYAHRSGFCLETQHYPDSPHFPEFPTTVLKKGDTFKSQTVYRFL